MKKFLTYTVFVCVLFMGTASYAVQYSEQEKQLFYDGFTFSYLLGLKKYVNDSHYTEQEKQAIYNFVKNNINREQLINQTWSCVQSKNPYDSVGARTCFVDWAIKQQQDLGQYLKTLPSNR